MFYTTLGAIGLTAEVVKMGFAYNNAMQSANVALNQVIKPQRVLNAELQSLFLIAAKTPFQVKDVTQAFRQMYIGFKPFHVSIGTLNDTILAITDNLSATGRVTPASLTRVSTALTHMANVGHLTGQAVLQLARDGLQLQPALQKELGLTSEQLQNIGKAGIPARDVLMALIKYSKSTPGIAGAAFRQANLTLGGAASSLKDYIAQASGMAIGGASQSTGIFALIQKKITGVNAELGKMSEHGKPVTLLEVATAMDRQLSPNTHILINLFITFSTTLKTVIIFLGVLLKSIQLLLRPLDYMGSLFGANHLAAKALGIGLGILAGFIIIGTTLWGSYRVVVDLVRATMYGLRGAIIAVTAVMKLQDLLLGTEGGVGLISKWRKWANATKTVSTYEGPVVLTGGAARSMEKEVPQNVGALAALSRPLSKVFDAVAASRFAASMGRVSAVFKAGGLRLAIAQLGTEVGALVPLFAGATSAVWLFVAANIEWIWVPLLIGAVIGGLILMYRKWQWFHDLVNHSIWIIQRYWKVFLSFVPGLNVLIGIVEDVGAAWGFFTSAINASIGAIKSVIHWIKKIPSHIPFLGSIMHAIGSAAHWATTSDVHATKRAQGGPVFGGGSVIVGEKGPEIVNLPGGSNVIPNNRLGDVRPIGYSREGGGHDRPIVVQVMLDRKVLAQGVARANQDYAARR
jgi:hypothetical protein